jgi:imidazole glycerol-phosphate synthase subunit HisF
VRRKRLIGVVTIKSGWVVQSFGYRRYLPVGKPECVIENLDNWGVDEILIQVIDRSKENLGPDYELLDCISRCSISTPLIYGGGIRNADDAVEVIRRCAERVCVDSVLSVDSEEVVRMARHLGGQAIVASLPVHKSEGVFQLYDYQTKKPRSSFGDLVDLVNEGAVSELVVIDAQNEGHKEAFNFGVLDLFEDIDSPLIVFGGLSEPDQIAKAFSCPKIEAVAVGNSLSYREHAVQRLKSKLTDSHVRPPFYASAFDLER